MIETRQDSPPIIEIRNVSKSYRSGTVKALVDLSLSIHPGEFVCVTGASGCGKSTLLNILGTLDRFDTGELLYRGQRLCKDDSPFAIDLDRFRAREIGFVFQSFYLLPNLTAVENVQIPMMTGDLSPHDRLVAAGELLEVVGLSDRAKHLPRELSIGQCQRVAIARAIANRPSLLLADEPTGNLDRASGAEIMELLKKLNSERGMTLVLITHDPTVAQQASRVLCMSDGRWV